MAVIALLTSLDPAVLSLSIYLNHLIIIIIIIVYSNTMISSVVLVSLAQSAFNSLRC